MEIIEESHRMQAAALWERWRRRRQAPGLSAGSEPFGRLGAAGVPREVALPAEALRHYRHFSWVIHEQRLMMLMLGALFGSCALVWTAALSLRRKPAVVVRAAPSLKEAAAAFYGIPEASYDQVAFFLQGCLPLLYAADAAGHPMLPLAQGLVAPEIYSEAERRLDGSQAGMKAHAMTQSLEITGVSDVVADPKSGRAAARLRGNLLVTVRQESARFYPWRAQVLLEVNPVSRLNPYPFYLLRLADRTGPDAAAWDAAP